MHEDAATTTTPSALIWGVKQSFREYVGDSQGTIEALDGASFDGEVFTFPAAPTVEAASEGAPLKFAGTAHFNAHGGMLDVTLSDPWIEITPTGPILTVVDTVSRTARHELARLDPVAVEGLTTSARYEARLSFVGSRLLGEVYRVDTLLDHVTVQTGD